MSYNLPPGCTPEALDRAMDPLEDWDQCPTCHGEGTIRPRGEEHWRRCPTCRGEGGWWDGDDEEAP